MTTFLEKAAIIPDSKHAFRLRCSRTTLPCTLLDSLSNTLDKKSGARVHAVFLDCSKAFDKVPHERLLSKLAHYGFKGQLLEWLKNFLSGRNQFVRYNGERSEPCEFTSGLIQSSVLGPLLFKIFVADLPSVVKTNIVQYADDCAPCSTKKNARPTSKCCVKIVPTLHMVC